MIDSAPRSLKLPRIDLPRSNVTRMFITAYGAGTPENSDAIRSLLGEADFFVSGTPYVARGKQHLISQIIDPENEDEDTPQMQVRIIYDASDYPDRVSIPRSDQRESEFLTHALSMKEPLNFWCNIEFRFPEVDNSELWFPLPSRIGGTDDTAEAFEILGVHAIKMPTESGEDVSYTFYLDLTPDGEVSLDLYFPLVRVFSLDLPKQALNEGLSIARRLVGSRAIKRRAVS